MKNKYLIILLSFIFTNVMVAQAQEEEEAPLSLSGSVDTYYKYDFSGNPNIGTSFGEDQNSFSIGMANLIASKEVGKASFVADLSFGPRSNGSIPNADFHIQNLYVSYALTDKLSVTGGYMGTFVGYEVISPTANFNYSTSYLFTNGPFQNAGLKFDYAVSDRVALMVGVFNDWNVYTMNDAAGNMDVNSFGAQLYLSPVDGWDAYINFVTGENNGNEIDLTTTYQVSDALLLGLNAASYSAPKIDNGDGSETDGGGFAGGALYVNYALSDAFALGFRGEYFSDDKLNILMEGEKSSVTAFTVSANIGSGPLKFIPELRLDSAEKDIFVDGDGAATGSAVQFLMAAVFAF
ncbi:porin [Flexithrix dorotheae]|uniref:porin n=1 Tax=Flexithrix dorotheae TaxID=70993 RepID=UPI000378102F|nr:porin [Flexithrix dorotheae]